MLQELTITNFAIIEQMRLAFRLGLITFTGETGAGKSIVLDAIGTLLGDRVTGDMVRTGEKRAQIEGIFLLPWLGEAIREYQLNPAHAEQVEQMEPHTLFARLLCEYGVYEEDEEHVILSREIMANGRSTARVNGHAVPVTVLSRLGALLVDIHGQHEHVALLRPERHADYLDRAADTWSLRRKFALMLREWQTAQREYAHLRDAGMEMERRAELLRFQCQEIRDAKLKEGEIEELERERKRLANAEKLRMQSEAAYQVLTGPQDSETQGILDLLAAAEKALRDIAHVDADGIAEPLAVLEESHYRLDDAVALIRDYRDDIEADPHRLDAVEQRLTVLARLRKRYGSAIAEILDFAKNAADELQQIESRDDRLNELEHDIELQRVVLGTMAADLSQRRQIAAEQLQQQVEAALDHLNMRNARFQVRISQEPDAQGISGKTDQQRWRAWNTGIDKVEFYIAPNPGEEPRPLARIASGGEMSRLMLAIKTVLTRGDATPILIFDEIDAGISGITGRIVGEMLWNLARQHHVICVTHLPQIAAYADQHWHVAKHIAADRTSTQVQELDSAGQIAELAQMLGGLVTENSARNAADLLDHAASWKQQTLSPPSDPVGKRKRR